MPPTSRERAVRHLEPGEVDVWLAEPPDAWDAALEAILDAAERAQLHRFLFAHNRSEYLAAHVLLRLTLSVYAPVPPAEWSFVRNNYGRPSIAGPESDWLRFNLSHTTGLVAVAVAFGRDVGVDVEYTGRSSTPLEIADQYFAPTEVADLRRLPAPAQPGAFFQYWTLKEAYIKARGMGLALPLDQFAFHLSADDRPRISFDPRLGDVPGDWQFAQMVPSACHHLALALRATAPLQTCVRRVNWSSLDIDLLW